MKKTLLLTILVAALFAPVLSLKEDKSGSLFKLGGTLTFALDNNMGHAAFIGVSPTYSGTAIDTTY